MAKRGIKESKNQRQKLPISNFKDSKPNFKGSNYYCALGEELFGAIDGTIPTVNRALLVVFKTV